MTTKLSEFLKSSLTAYHTCDNAKKFLLENGFECLVEREDWALKEDGKYFVERGGGSLIAFTIGSLEDFAYKIIASHTDSPALKLKENPSMSSEYYVSINVEKYGGGIWYSFFDRPLKIAGRVIKNVDGLLVPQTVTSEYNVTIPSVAIHMNKEANNGFAINPQIDLKPLYSLSGEEFSPNDLLAEGDNSRVVAYDLFVINADTPYSFGKNNEFLASPRIDNLTSVFASLEALVSNEERSGVCIAALLNNEEVGNLTAQGADGDFLENVLKRIASGFRFDDDEYFKALASSFLISADNAHAVHPNHPEKSDPTNRTELGGGVVIKAHANKMYITDAVSSAIVKTLFENANVKYQYFFNRSDMKSGSTLGVATLSHIGVKGVDIGIAQLAMHSACECFAKSDYTEMVNGLTAFFDSTILFTPEGILIR